MEMVKGDYNGSQNNVAQLLANRGTVAWATDEAQDILEMLMLWLSKHQTHGIMHKKMAY